MSSPSYPVSRLGTLFSLISNRAPVLRLWLLSAPHFHTVCDQAPGSTSFLCFVSDAAAFPGPPFLRDCGFDLLRPSVEGLTEQWPGAGHPQECLRYPDACRCPETVARCQPSPEKFRKTCSSSASGIMENHNTHLTPGFTPNDLSSTSECGLSLGSAVPRWLQNPYQMPSHQWNGSSQCGPRTSWTPLCSLVFTLPTRAPALPGIELKSFRLCTLPVYSLNGI